MSSIIEHHGYIFWRNIEVVENYVWDFLQKKFPDSIIFPELFGADFVILKENIPVEVQSTIVLDYKKGTEEEKIIVAHSQFEQYIEKQIKQNVEHFGSCLFFFDSEYLRYLQNELTRGTRINLDWLYQLMKEGNVNAFTISHDGIITEISHKALNFLTDVSMTCKIGQNEDYRILDRNKFKIISNVLKGYRFTSEELFKFREGFGESGDRAFIDWLLRKGCSQREFLFGSIIRSAGSLEFINQILGCEDDGTKLTRSNKYLLSTLGLFEVKGEAKGAVTHFVDKFEIAHYFPGYLINKNVWDSLRTNYITLETLRKVVTKKIKIVDINKQETEIKRKKKETIRDIILKANNFTANEINEFRKKFEIDINSGGIFRNWLQKPDKSERQKLLGQILQFTTNTHLVDNFFARKDDTKSFRRLKVTLVLFGITEAVKGGKDTKIKYIDKYQLSGLFEKYDSNKEFWDSIKNKMLNYHDFWSLVYNKNKEQSKLVEFV